LYALNHRAVVRRFVAVKLNGMKTQRQCKILEIRGIGMIHKDSNEGYKRWKLFDNLRRFRGINVSWAVRPKVQANRVCSKQHRVACVFEFGNPADLHACHSKPRSVVTASDDVRKCSPMRNASAPASSRRTMSARLWIPLSTTNTRSSGMSFESRS